MTRCDAALEWFGRLRKAPTWVAIVAVCACAFSGATCASASGAAWWGLTSALRPTVITPGIARPEIQTLVVSATGGSYKLARSELSGGTVTLQFNESAAGLQAALEGLYGAGDVTVSGGPGDATGSKPYGIEFHGQLSDQPIEPLVVSTSNLTGGSREATVTESQRGRSDGQVQLEAENLGDATVETTGADPVRLADKLPRGLRVVGASGSAPLLGGSSTERGPIPCSVIHGGGSEGDSVVCEFVGSLAPFDALELRADVIDEGAAATAVNTGDVSGAGAPGRHLERTVDFSGGGVAYGVEKFEMMPEEAGGGPAIAAGAHPFQLTTTVAFNQGEDRSALGTSSGKTHVEPIDLTKDVRVKLPLGLVGNPEALPQCPLAKFDTPVRAEQFGGNGCPADTAIGVASITVNEPSIIKGSITFAQPIFNVEPAYGEPARFGFFIAISQTSILLDASVHRESDGAYRVWVSANNAPETAGLLSSTLTFWGTPSDPRHENSRGWGCMEETRGAAGHGFPCSLPSSGSDAPFQTMPTSCDGPMQTSVGVDSWQHPLSEPAWMEPSLPLPALSGCGDLTFAPAVTIVPTTNASASPSGLEFNVGVHDEGLLAGGGRAQSDIKKVVVTLPEGLTANPSVAVGLGACSEAQYESETVDSEPGSGCPSDSKLGDVEVRTPLLPQKLEGSVYLARQEENPFHSLIALYVVIKDPEAGILIRLAGKVEPNPVTGQLVTTFDQNPQLPFSSFTFKFRQGQRSPLVTPSVCGTYDANTDLSPWAAPESVKHEISRFQITTGIAGGPCSAGGLLPFAPTVAAGTESNAAGSYSPLDVRITRGDGEQEITGFSSVLPPGVTANLSGVPFCSEADIATASGKTGAQEEAEPSCPAASLIGHTLVGVGVGSVLAYTPGRLYMAGPLDGEPFSVVAITSAHVGPFDLGTVIVRLPINIDPHTAVVTVAAGGADQIPHIVKGIVVHVRDIRVSVDRAGFVLNPTSCRPLTFTATIAGAGQDVASAADDSSYTTSNRFQSADCGHLAFKPSFTVSTSGKTSRKNGASLSVKLTYPKAPFGTQANVGSVHVELPKALPSRLSTLNHACPDSVFNRDPAGCPSQSRVGFAKAVTPVLPVPLEGPAYFVSHGGQKFPELIVVLQGYGVTVDLEGETFISKAGITSSTFNTVPDVPVSSFELTLPEGPFSALAANRNLCQTSLAMPTTFTGQNGAVVKQNTKIAVTGCRPAIRVVGHSVKGSHASIRVSVLSAGTLVASGKGIGRSVKRTGAAGVVTIGVTLSGRDLRVLAKNPHQRVNAKVRLRFKPRHGAALTATVRLLMG